MDYDQESMDDLKKRVTELLDDAKARAMEKIDKLQLAGADILGDHKNNAGKSWLTPRDFIAAFAEDMKYTEGWVRLSDTPTRKRTIKNYLRLM